MSHCDDDDLALLALGEDVITLDRSHLATCATCRERFDSYATTVAIARGVTPEDRPVAPPDAVWTGILAQLDATGAGGTSTAGPAASPAPAAPPAGGVPDDRVPDDRVPEGVVAMAPRRARRSTWVIAVAAGFVGLALGAVLGSGILRPEPTGRLVASAPLGGMGEYRLAGLATVEQSDGASMLTVSVPDLPQVPDGYYEVWLATADAVTMVAVGTMSPGQEAHLVLPAGLDLTTFPVVDVSVEHYDGDPGHSATSVVRGRLDA